MLCCTLLLNTNIQWLRIHIYCLKYGQECILIKLLTKSSDNKYTMDFTKCSHHSLKR